MKQYLQPISIIVPTLNEVGNLPQLFERIDTTLRGNRIGYEIIVVDDHSSDGTADWVLQADRRYNARLLMKRGKRGKAYSLIEGFEAARCELLAMIDADLQYPPEALKQMYFKLQSLEADIVVTERIDKQTSILRRLSSLTFNLLFVRLLFGIKFDTQSGLKLFRKDVLRNITLSPSPWTFDLEFLVKAIEQNFVVISQVIPFSERHAGVPKVKLFSATLEIVGGSLKLWRTTNIKRVKLNYKYLEVVQNSLTWLVGFTIVGSLLLANQFDSHKVWQLVSSQSSSIPIVRQLTDIQSPGLTKKAAVKAITPPPSTTTTTTISPTVTQAADASNVDSQTSTTPGSSSTTSTTKAQVADSTTSTLALQTNTSTEKATQTPTPAAISSISVGQNEQYYPDSKLSANRTSQLLSDEHEILGVAGLFTALGAITLVCTNLTTKSHRQVLRS